MNKFIQNMKSAKQLIGMIHVKALPGTPANSLNVKEITELAVEEALIYRKAGLDAVMLENMHDTPYLNQQVGPEITSSMSVITSAVKNEVNLPCGIQVLAGANREALAIAKACDLNFIRVENFAYSHIADEGFMESCAGDLLRFRKTINAESVAIFTDVKKKHSSHFITSDVSLPEAVHTHEFFLSDGIIITGRTTGASPDKEDLVSVQNSTKLPVIIGSGITADNITRYWKLADAFIIGSYFKLDGIWSNKLSLERINKFVKVTESLRGSV